MPAEITLVVTPKQAADQQEYTALAAREMGVKVSQIAYVRVTRRSIDARKRDIKVNLGLQIWVDEERPADEIHFEYQDVSSRTEVLIVGSGPAGLFAALRLIELGYKPIVLERGKDVSARKFDIAAINRNESVNPDSNYAFGEGGAGTYSDGKLFTRSKKRGDFRKALEVFKFHGADESILYDAHPHIGTDKLPRVIEQMRESILKAGGQICFGRKVTDLIIKDNRILGVIDEKGDKIEAAATILATGHSARDIYRLLDAKGVAIEAKPFAMGVRVEHPQSYIDTIQYKTMNRGEYLPPASYQLVAQVGGRGVYSFCMCPGGFIVPAMTDNGESVVNGMSPSGRNSVHANSGIVTEVKLSDFESLRANFGELAGLEFQRQLEMMAFAQGGGGQIAPAQGLADFVSGKPSSRLADCSYHPGLNRSEMHRWLPSFIGKSLQEGFGLFNNKMRGFVTNEAVVVGVESRTSSPVRIPRDKETCMHTQIAGLFPAGEGAGYAGGIISAALDGELVANMVTNWLSKK